MPTPKSLIRLATTSTMLAVIAIGSAFADDDSLPPPRPPGATPGTAPGTTPSTTPASPAPAPAAPEADPIAPPAPRATPVEAPPAEPPTAPPPEEPKPSSTPPPAVAAPKPEAPKSDAPAAAVPGPERGSDAGAPETLEALARQFDAEEKASAREMRRRRYEATFRYVQTHPTAKDREEALASLVTLAFDAEWWDRVPARVDAYAEHVRAAHGLQPLPVDFLFDKAYALGKLGLEAQGRAAYGALVGALSLKLHSKGVVVRGWSSYAYWLADLGDIAGAKAQWRGLKAIFQTIPPADGKPFMNMADDEVKYLDQVGHEPPAFPADARDLDGKPISLGEYRGKYLLLDFWATWCKPCKEEFPNVLDAYRRWHEKGFEVVGIVVNEPQDGAKVREFVAEKALPWRQIHYATPSNPIKTAYGVYGVPYTMLLGPDGRVIRIGLRGSELRTVLARYFEPPK